jgi:putative aldouronate transport system permease protein
LIKSGDARTISKHSAVARNAQNYIRRMLKSWQLYVLILPAVLYFVVFHFWPIYGLQIAFRSYRPKLGILGSEWVGLDHFVRFVTGPNFKNLISNTLRISIGNLLLGFPVPVVLALVLNEIQAARYKRIVQTVSYAPHFISLVVMVSMLRIFLNVNTGIINKLIGLVGAGPYDFLSKGAWFASIYVISNIWQSAGWGSIIYLAALSGVDASQTEAAMVDGATRLQRIWHVNLPAIMPTIIIMFILDSGKIMSVGYEKAYLMQTPLNLQYSEIISTYVYKIGLLNAQYSFSAAVGLFNSVINLILLLSVNAISRKISSTGLL